MYTTHDRNSNLPEMVEGIGVKNGVETPLGQIPMPDIMKAKEFITSFYGRNVDDDGSEANTAWGLMEEFLKWQTEQRRRIALMNCNAAIERGRLINEGIHNKLLDNDGKVLLEYYLFKTERRLTFDIINQDERTRNKGTDDTPITFKASNGVEIITRSRMDIQTDRIWLLGCSDDTRSGSMVFGDNNKRDKMYDLFQTALQEWAAWVIDSLTPIPVVWD